MTTSVERVLEGFDFLPGLAVKKEASVFEIEPGVFQVGLLLLDGVSAKTGVDYSYDRVWLLGQFRRMARMKELYVFSREAISSRNTKPEKIAARVLNVKRLIEGDHRIVMTIRLTDTSYGEALGSFLRSNRAGVCFSPATLTNTNAGIARIERVMAIGWYVEGL